MLCEINRDTYNICFVVEPKVSLFIITYDENLVFGHYTISLQLCLRRVQVLFTVSRPAGQGRPLHTAAAAGATAVAYYTYSIYVVLSDHLAPRELD